MLNAVLEFGVDSLSVVVATEGNDRIEMPSIAKVFKPRLVFKACSNRSPELAEI
jgi:hypothetical protein